MSPRRAILAAVAAFIVVNVLFLGSRPVLTADETRYGSIAAQMVERGEWLDLQMSGFKFYEKPPLVTWMMAASIELFGHTGFAIRLPMALCGGLAALAVAVGARRGAMLVGRGRDEATVTGALVALCALTMALPAVGASVAILDMPIAAFTVSASVAVFMAATGPVGRARLGWLAVAGVMAGLAFMTKGLLALVFPAMAVAPWLAWERRWRDLFTMPWIPLVVGALIVLPWAIAVSRAHPGFWHRFIVHEHVQRFLGTGANQQREPMAFYLLVVPLGAVPWIVTLPMAARRWPALARGSAGVRFAACAVLGPLLFLSLSRGKLPTYALPLFPPLAWLLVEGLLAAFASMPMRGGRAAAMVPGSVLVLLGLAAFMLAFSGDVSGPTLSLAWLDAPHAHAAIMGAALVLWGAGDLIAQRSPAGPRRLAWMGLSPVAALASFGLLFPDAMLSDALATGRSIESERSILCGAGTLFCDQKLAHASAWFLEREDFLVVDAPREFRNGLARPEDDARLVDDRAFPARLSAARAQGSACLAAATHIVDRLLALKGVPTPMRRADHRGWALVEFAPAR
jgi:4-amino-4-deoxy-L-arabinose transferase